MDLSIILLEKGNQPVQNFSLLPLNNNNLTNYAPHPRLKMVKWLSPWARLRIQILCLFLFFPAPFFGTGNPGRCNPLSLALHMALLWYYSYFLLDPVTIASFSFGALWIGILNYYYQLTSAAAPLICMYVGMILLLFSQIGVSESGCTKLANGGWWQ